MRSYPYRHIDPVPWMPLAKPLAQCRLALVTSAGFVAPGQHHSTTDSRRRCLLSRDSGRRRCPPAHESHRSNAFDHTGIAGDPNLGFPIERVRELVTRGRIGSVNHPTCRSWARSPPRPAGARHGPARCATPRRRRRRRGAADPRLTDVQPDRESGRRRAGTPRHRHRCHTVAALRHRTRAAATGAVRAVSPWLPAGRTHDRTASTPSSRRRSESSRTRAATPPVIVDYVE